MTDCKYAEHCGGGHTTARHKLTVYERVIKQECGLETYKELDEALRDLERLRLLHGNGGSHAND